LAQCFADVAGIAVFKTFVAEGVRQLIDVADGTAGEQWLHALSSRFADTPNALYRVDTNGALLEEWQARGTFYDVNSGRNLWRTEHGAFFASTADIPGKGGAIQIFRASDEFINDGFE
jgi:catechol 2,3-dioxygenase-like lactoylglutathione lyase family enzyme